MITRRLFLKKITAPLGVLMFGHFIEGYSQTARPRASKAHASKKRIYPRPVNVYIELTEKNRSDYASEKSGGGPLKKAAQGGKDYFVVSALVSQHPKIFKKALASGSISKSDRSLYYRKEAAKMYHELSKLPADYRHGFEAYEVYIDKAKIPPAYKTKKGSINRNELYLKLITLLLETCDLSRFHNVFVYTDRRVIRNVSQENLGRHFNKNRKKGPKQWFYLQSTERFRQPGLQIADLFNYVHLQVHQPYPLPGRNIKEAFLIRKFMLKMTDASAVI